MTFMTGGNLPQSVCTQQYSTPKGHGQGPQAPILHLARMVVLHAGGNNKVNLLCIFLLAMIGR